LNTTGNSAIRALVAAVRPQAAGSLASRGLHLATALYQILGLAVLVAGLVLAFSWLGQPFPGALLDQARAVTRAAPVGKSDTWGLVSQGLGRGDQVQAVGGLPVRSTADLRSALSAFSPGDTVEVSIHPTDAPDFALQATLTPFPSADRVAYLIFPTILGLISLMIGIWVFAVRGSQPTGRAIATLCASMGIVCNSFFDSLTSHGLTLVGTVALALLAASLLDFSLRFPTQTIKTGAQQYLVPALYAAAAAVALYSWAAQVSAVTYDQESSALQPLLVWLVLAVSASFLLEGYEALSGKSPVPRAEGTIVSMAIFLSTGPLAAWALLAPQKIPTFSPLLLLPFAIFPGAVGRMLLRGRLNPVGDRQRDTLTYAALSILLTAAYALVVGGLSLVLRTSIPPDNPLWIGGLVVVLAVALEPARKLLQTMVDRAFARVPDREAEAIADLRKALDDVAQLPAINRIVRQTLQSTLAPTSVHVFVLDGFRDQFVSLPDDSGRAATDIRFASDGALARYLGEEPLPLALGRGRLPEALEPDAARITVLGARLLVRLRGTRGLLGWIAIGAGSTREPYRTADLRTLQDVAAAASHPVQRAQSLADLERRRRENEAITRLAQGANVTLDFDNVLELIYAQSAHVIPLSDMQITSWEKARSVFAVEFAVHDGKRLDAQQIRALRADSGLDAEVIRNGRAMLVHDYGHECQSRGLTPASDGPQAWVGVSMNASGETIGALSVASRDQAIRYTSGHVDLLQAIADQAAGAILQARLLHQAQEHAGQLARLNEVARQIASTLELEPLLQSIAAGSRGVLDAVAGIVYLVDIPTSDLVVSAVAGDAADEPVGKRLANAASLTRSLAATGGFVPESARETGRTEPELLSAQPLRRPTSMAAPLQAQDRIIGMLRVGQRRDGFPYGERDEALLAALAGQAAVAIENARLYMSTDQELASRVEELSVMQRIDRELNTTLEADRAMRITLEWALRHSGTEAGLIGMLEGTDFRVVAHSGYAGLPGADSDPLPGSKVPALKAALETGTVQQTDFRQSGAQGLLPGSDHQTVVPIRREASVIGVLVLEGTGGAREDTAFLGRLCDHAAVAISNAQLYDEIRRANAAKSEFVSLVAHELRNPMTAIKGYAELLAAGTVGPITETQANFLDTIRANTERISTLVSDLNDNSKIEAGQLRLDFRPLELGPVVEETVRSSKRQIDEKHQTIDALLPPGLPYVWADAVRLGQVLTNLISNANKYTPEGGQLFVGAAVAENRWDTAGANQVVHVWVRDTGIGIRPEDQPRIFGKFFRSEDPKAREISGVGLGLNITRSLVEMQGGRVWFDTEYGKGTTFHFTVPVAQV
jgi:signal transduction histidine kinase